MSSTDASEQPGREGQPPRAFVSYSDDSAAHARRVLELAQWLRSHGVDAQIDQFEESPEEGWPRWIYRQIREAEFVLIIATPGYLRRCESEEPRADATSSSTKFGSHLTLQELHEAGGRNRKFIPVLFGEDAVVESVPLPLRGATCYRLPAQRDDLYRRLTGQPKVLRAPLGVLKTFDDESLSEGEDGDGGGPLTWPEPLARGRGSLDEQRTDDSLAAVVEAGIVEDPTREREARARRARRRNRQWLITIASFGAAFLAVGLWIGRGLLAPESQPICRIQLTDNGDVVEGIDRVDLELPSGHLIEVVVEDGRTLRFACPPDRVHVQAHVYLDRATEGPSSSDPTLSRDAALRLGGRVELSPRLGVGSGEVTQAKLFSVIPARPIRPREPESEPKPELPRMEPSPKPPDPEPDTSELEVVNGLPEPSPPGIKVPVKRTPKVTPLSESPELQTKLAAHLAELQRCYEQGLAEDPGLRGELVGDVRTDANGQVVDFTIVRNDFSRTSPEVAACVRKEIISWKVNKPKNPRGTVERISIEFTPVAI